jgi:hypothetical protein
LRIADCEFGWQSEISDPKSAVSTMPLRPTFNTLISRPMVRPWALSAPVLVLILCLPMLRPLRQPGDPSMDEALRLATVESLVRSRSLALDVAPQSITAEAMGAVSGEASVNLHGGHLVLDEPGRVFVSRGQTYANQPPMMAVLLAGPAWVMQRWLGLKLDESHALISYVLTVLGVTLPVAGAAGLLYRMGRLFELSRPWRAGLAVAVVAGSGLLSYAVVLNPHAPAAVLVLCAAACLVHVSMTKLPRRGIGWMTLGGACAALATALDPPSGFLGLLLLLVIATMRFPLTYRAAAIFAFLLGAAAPIAVHATWAYPLNGEIIPGFNHARFVMLGNREEAPISTATRNAAAAASSSSAARTASPGAALLASEHLPAAEIDADDVISPPSRWDTFGQYAGWLSVAFVGAHGIFSHFPVMILGILGVLAVMHRHWPHTVKMLAGASIVGAVLVISSYATSLSEWRGGGGAMFASRWFVVFLPFLLFWAGAWLRRSHTPLVWTATAAVFAFSTVVSLVGMTQPYPPDGYDRYTPAQALQRLVQPDTTRDAIAGR